jgi:ribosomal protein S18 acetylase RimI-like enzyme
LAALDAQLREELTAMRGGGLWAVRESRPGGDGESFAALLERDDACVVVGSVDDYVVGFGIAELERLRDGSVLGRITELFVDPEARAVGVGEAIAVELVAFCEAHDCIGIDALALPGHRAAKNFFEASGFTARAIVMHRPRHGKQ